MIIGKITFIPECTYPKHSTLYRHFLRNLVSFAPKDYLDNFNITDKLRNIIENNHKIDASNKNIFNYYWNLTPTSADELMKTKLLPYINPRLFTNYIREHYYNKTIRKLCRNELIFSSDNIKLCKQIIKGLDIKLNSFPNLEKSSDILKWCLEDSFERGDDVIASDIFISYYRIYPNENPTQNNIDILLTKLSVPNPVDNHLRLQNFISLHELIKNFDMKFNFSRLTLENWYNIFLNQEFKEPQLIKEATDLIFGNDFIYEKNSLNMKLKIAYTMIEWDIKKTNFSGAYLTWLKIKDLTKEIYLHDSKTLASLLKVATLESKYKYLGEEIINRIPKQEYCNNPILLPVVISYVLNKKSLTLARNIVDDMRLHTTNHNQQIIWKSKETLLALFKLQLMYYDDGNINKILKEVVQLYGKVTSEFYIAIVSYLMETEKLENVKRATKILDSINNNHTYSICSSIMLSRLVYWEINNKTIIPFGCKSLINELISKMHEKDPKHIENFWFNVDGHYVKYLITMPTDVDIKEDIKCFNEAITAETKKNISMKLDLVKYIYIKSNIDRRHIVSNKIPTINPFLEVQSQNIRFKLTKRANIKILKNIAVAALKISKFDLFQWCCSMLYQEGVSKEEQLFLWNLTFDRDLREVKFTSLKQVQETLRSNGKLMITKLLV